MFSETIPSSVKGMFYLPGMVALRDPLPKLSTLLVYYFCNQSVLQISYTKYTFSRLEV